MWAGHPDGFLQVNPMWAGHPDGFLQVNTLLLYPSLSPYTQTDGRTDGQTDGETNTLAIVRVGWRNLFSSCAVVFLFLINTLLLYPSLSPYTD